MIAGAGNDIIYYGGALTAADMNDGGDGDQDVLVLQGNYALTLGVSSLVNVEYMSMQSGTVTKFGQDGLSSYDYSITTLDDILGLHVRSLEQPLVERGFVLLE